MTNSELICETLPLLTIESATEQAKTGLLQVEKKFGFVPNLWATLANSPIVLNGYLKLESEWERSSLTPRERYIVFLTVSVANNCPYCVAGYSMVLKDMHIDKATIQAIRDKENLPDARLDALVSLTREMVSKQGAASRDTKQRFIDAGYKESTIMELLLGIALKTIANYAARLYAIPLDEVYQSGI